jgi:FtsZ-interacting cell division protein ZipA
MFGTGILKYVVLFALLLGVVNLTSSSLFNTKKSVDVEKFEEEKNSLQSSVTKLEKIASDLKNVVDEMNNVVNVSTHNKNDDDQHEDEQHEDNQHDDDEQNDNTNNSQVKTQSSPPPKKETYKPRRNRKNYKKNKDVEEFVNGMPSSFGGDYLLL